MQKKLLSQKWHDKQSVVDGALKNKTGDGSLSQNEYDVIGSRGQFFCPLDFTSISDGTYTTSYAYDSANQLIREDNQEAGTTTVWTYDNAGNILTRTVYPYDTGTTGERIQTNYRYTDTQWGDLAQGTVRDH